MSNDSPSINQWKKLHSGFYNEIAVQYKEEIQRILNISQSCFYRKLSNPSRLSIAEKWAISRIYDLEETYLFPELAEISKIIKPRRKNQ